ncbi:MAG: uroporphyrinogen decarboxylase [Thermoplasmata archaeon]
MQSDFVLALKGENHDRIPVWFMRQAGRYLPSYNKIRSTKSIKDICSDPVISAEITYDPVSELGVDSAIVFSDILLPLEAMGLHVDYLEGIGPTVETGKRDRDFQIGSYDSNADKYKSWETIRIFRKNHRDVPIIGFCGGPVTIASYAINGRADRELANFRKFMYAKARQVSEILSELKEMIIANAREQIRAGADAVQIFESWAGSLSRDEYQRTILPIHREIFSEIGKVPLILFSTASHHLTRMLTATGTDFISVDWRENISEISAEIPNEIGIQGNLDPMLAESFPEEAFGEARRIAESMRDRNKYIFNLGHGVLPGTNPATLREIVKIVHQTERVR